MAEHKEIVRAVRELNKVLGLKPPIATGKDDDRMLDELREAAELIEPQDEITPETRILLAELAAEGAPEEDEEEPAEEDEDDGAGADVEEDVEDEEDRFEETEDEERGVDTPDEPPSPEEPVEEPSEVETFSLSVYRAGTEEMVGEVAGRPMNLADHLDMIVLEGGDWDAVMAKVEKARRLFPNPRPINRSSVRYHIYGRMKRGYFGIPVAQPVRIRVTQDGIFVEPKEAS